MLEDTITITAQVVASSAYHPRAAAAVYHVMREQDPDDGYLPDLQAWSETGGHLPVIWGSGWACDVPYLLNKMIADGCTDDELRLVIRDLRGPTARVADDWKRPEVRGANDAWQSAFRVAKEARHEASTHDG